VRCQLERLHAVMGGCSVAAVAKPHQTWPGL